MLCRMMPMAVGLAGLLVCVGTVRAGEAEDAVKEARRLMTDGKPREAIPHLDRAIRLKPQDPEAYVLRGMVRHHRFGSETEQALADFAKALSLDPRCAPAHFQRGLVRGELKDFDGAISDFAKVIELTPDDARAFVNRGVYRAAKGDLDGAIADDTRAIELVPRDVRPYVNRADHRNSKRDFDGAVEDYSRVIEIDPKHACAHFERGNVRRTKGDFKGAEADYSKAIEINPRHVRAYAARASVRMDRGDFEGALADRDKTVEIEPYRATWRYARSAAHLAAGHGAPAAADARRYLDGRGWSEPSSPYAALFAYFGDRRAGDATSAMKMLDEAAGRLDRKAWPYPVFAHLRGETTEAALLESADNDDKRTEARTYLALHLLSSGSRGQAVGHLRWVSANGNKTFNEYRIAVAELARLEAAKKP